ncbi:unnamed protein product, partial [Symbiodinium natans]
GLRGPQLLVITSWLAALPRWSAATRTSQRAPLSGPPPPSRYPIHVSDLGLVPYNIPTTSTTTLDPAIREFNRVVRQPKYCRNDILVEVEGWNQFDEYIHQSSILEEEPLNGIAGAWVWTTENLRRGSKTKFFLGCNISSGRPVLMREAVGDSWDFGIVEIPEGGAATQLWVHFGQDEEDQEQVEFVPQNLFLMTSDVLRNGTIMLKDVYGLRKHPKLQTAPNTSCTRTVALEIRGSSFNPQKQVTYEVSKRLKIPAGRYSRLGGLRLYSVASSQGEEMYWLRCDHATGEPLLLKRNAGGPVEERHFEFGSRRTDLQQGERLELLAEASLMRPLLTGYIMVSPQK